MSTDHTALALTPVEVADSRGRPTVGVHARWGGHAAFGDVPAGASKGADEARTVPVPEAIAQIGTRLAPALAAAGPQLHSVDGVVAVDHTLAQLAGPGFAAIGANATLPVSRALWRLAAACQGVPLHRLLAAALPPRRGPPRRCLFMMNIFNGGLHALRQGEVLGRDRIAIQEIMAVPVRARSYAQALAMGDRIDAALAARLIARYGAAAVGRADEAGFSVRGLGDSAVALAHVRAAVRDAGLALGAEVKLALDVAAGSLLVPAGDDAPAGHYRLDGRVLAPAEMVAALTELVDGAPGEFLSVEDGLGEDDWAHWPALTAALSARDVQTIGDDLFVTQLPRLRRGLAAPRRAAGAILIKVNQNGTVGGTLEVIAAAQAAGMACVVSHRSGETLDDSIADLAFAAGALALKSGDPQPPADFPDPRTWVRRRKYLRMVEIEAGG